MADDDKRKKNPKAQKKTPKVRLTETFRPAAALGNQAVVKGKEAIAKASETAGKLVEKGKATVATVKEAFGPEGKARPAVNKARAAAGAAKAGAESVVESAKAIPSDPRVVEATGKVKEAAADAKTAAQNLIDENAPKAKKTLRDLGGSAKEQGGKLLNTLKDQGGKGLRAAKQFFDTNAPKVVEAARTGAERAAVTAEELAAESKRIIAEGGPKVQDKLDEIVKLGKEGTPKALDALRNLVDQGRAKVGQTIEAASQRAPKAAADLRDAFRTIGAAPEELTTRAKQFAGQFTQPDVPGIEVAGEAPGPQSGPKAPPRPAAPPSAAARAITGAGRVFGGPASVALDQAFTPTDEIVPRLFRQATSIGGPLGGQTPLDFALRKARGESTIDAGIGALRDFANPLSFGLIDKGQGGDPITQAFDRGNKLTPFQHAQGALGFGPTQEEFDAQNAILASEDVASGVPAQVAGGAGLPTPTQQATLRDAGAVLEPGRGVGPGGAPAARFDETGAREFTAPDARAAAAGIDPASRRGTATVEENQAVLDRLLARNQGLRATQFAQGQQAAPVGGGGQQTTLDRVASQARGGGIASAFGALALGGNQLRRDAADRSRAAASTAAIQESDLKLRNKLTEIGAQGQVKKNANFAKDTISLGESYNKALDSNDPQQIATVKSGIFQGALRDPTGAASATAAGILADDIMKATETGFFAALFSVNPFTGGRGLSDAIASAGQGKNIFQNFNNEFQDAINKMVLNTATGDLSIASPDGSGNPQFVVNIKDLPPETRNYVSQGGVRQAGAGQELTRGDPNLGDPRLPSI